MNRAVNTLLGKSSTDAIWETLRKEVEQQLEREPILAAFAHPIVLDHDNFECALSALLAQKLECPALSQNSLRNLCAEVYKDDPEITQSARLDLLAVCDRDPACSQYSIPFLYYKGFQGLQMYRVSHWLWHHNRRDLARYLQSRTSETFAMDIHPAAQVGNGILIDHATSIVIGETAVVGDNVSMLHEVTLGGTGKDAGDRHPKIASGVLIGAGAKILGNVKVGEGAKIGAGSVVLDDVLAHYTVAGVPARPVSSCSTELPALEMDHSLTID
ncbi:MAG: serine O-acetyltransferase [Arenicellales bacterium]